MAMTKLENLNKQLEMMNAQKVACDANYALQCDSITGRITQIEAEIAKIPA